LNLFDVEHSVISSQGHLYEVLNNSGR
jgi:hypothetical protein